MRRLIFLPPIHFGGNTKYGKTLSDMKRAARLYAGVEKEGVQMVVQANRCWGSDKNIGNQGGAAACVIDLEIALSKQAEQEDVDEEQGGAERKRGATAKE